MPQEIGPSSYLCDCGRRMDFFESTIREMKQDSLRRRSLLADGFGSEEHRIVFDGGVMVGIICPMSRQGTKKAGSTTGSRERTRVKRPGRRTGTKGPTKAELDRLVAEATVDCHDEEERACGFHAILESELELSFNTTILGVPVRVEGLELTPRGEIVARCVGQAKRQRIRLVDVPLPDPPPRGARWIAALRHWLHED